MTDEIDAKQLEDALRKALATFESMMWKVINTDPSWDQVSRVLTEDEMRVFEAVLSWNKATIRARRPPYFGA